MTRRDINMLTLSLGPTLAALALATGDARAMTSPRLIEPAEVAGAWTLSKAGGGSCQITLKTQKVEGTGGYAVELGDCGTAGAPLKAITNWRVSSDGIALAEADRSTVMFLSRQSNQLLKTSGQSSLKAGGSWTMTR